MEQRRVSLAKMLLTATAQAELGPGVICCCRRRRPSLEGELPLIWLAPAGQAPARHEQADGRGSPRTSRMPWARRFRGGEDSVRSRAADGVSPGTRAHWAQVGEAVKMNGACIRRRRSAILAEQSTSGDWPSRECVNCVIGVRRRTGNVVFSCILKITHPRWCS